MRSVKLLLSKNLLAQSELIQFTLTGNEQPKIHLFGLRHWPMGIKLSKNLNLKNKRRNIIFFESNSREYRKYSPLNTPLDTFNYQFDIYHLYCEYSYINITDLNLNLNYYWQLLIIQINEKEPWRNLHLTQPVPTQPQVSIPRALPQVKRWVQASQIPDKYKEDRPGADHKTQEDGSGARISLLTSWRGHWLH